MDRANIYLKENASMQACLPFGLEKQSPPDTWEKEIFKMRYLQTEVKIKHHPKNQHDLKDFFLL